MLKFSDLADGKIVEINNPTVSLEYDDISNNLLLNVAGLRFILRGVNDEKRKDRGSNNTRKIMKFLFDNPNKPFHLKMLDGELDRNFNCRLDDILRKGLRPLPYEKIKCFCKGLTTKEVIFCPEIPLGDFLEADKSIDFDFPLSIKQHWKQGILRKAGVTFVKKPNNVYRVGFAFYNRVKNGDDIDVVITWLDEANFWHRYDLSAIYKTNFSISILSPLT